MKEESFPDLSPSFLNSLAETINHRYGIWYAPEHRDDLKRIVREICQKKGCQTVSECQEYLSGIIWSGNDEDDLISYLTISETYFFRDRHLFLMLRDEIFPELIRMRKDTGRTMRIWSAACSSGEEPYSLSLLLHALLPDFNDWNILILGSDLNIHNLEKAERGIYSPWSFRDKPLVNLGLYITKTGNGQYQVADTIRKSVKFERMNLVQEKPLAVNHMNMDLIFCRNVLMYFREMQIMGITQRFFQCLRPGGLLVVGPQEISHAHYSGFHLVERAGLFYFQKPGPGISLPPVPEPPVCNLREHEAEILLPLDAPSREEETGQATLSERTRPDADGAPATELHRLFHDADLLFSSGDLTGSEEKLSALLDRDPRYLPALLLETRIAADRGKREAALSWCRKALEIDPLNPSAHYLQATIWMESGEEKNAMHELKQALYADMDHLPSHLLLGTIYKSQGKKKEASRHLKTALQIMNYMNDADIVQEAGGISVKNLREMILSLEVG